MLITDRITFITKGNRLITETSWVRGEDERGTDWEAPGQGAASLSETVGARVIKNSLSACILFFLHVCAMGNIPQEL